jgi:membrane protein required for colicin V production
VTVFDYAVLGVIGISALIGLWRGVVSEVLALVAWVAGFMAARAWAEPVGSAFATWIGEPALRHATGFVVVMIGVLILFAVGRWVLSLLLKAVGLGPADRLLGAVFGVARGMLIVLVALLLAGMTALPKSQWWRDAWLAPPLETAAIAAKAWLPVEVAKRIRYR